MDLEARSAPKAEVRALQTRAKKAKEEVSAIRTSLKHAVISGPPRTNGGCSSGDEAGETGAEKARLLKMGERLHEGTSKLQQAHRTVLETEQIGINIMADLRSQRETIMHSTGTLQRASESLTRSKRVLNAIAQRALANKLLMWLMIGLLSLGVLFLLYVQIFGLGGGGNSPAGDGTNATRT